MELHPNITVEINGKLLEENKDYRIYFDTVVFPSPKNRRYYLPKEIKRRLKESEVK